MKKKLIVVLLLCLMIPSVFLFAGCNQSNPSSYQITVSSDNSNMGNVYGSGYYTIGSQVYIVAVPNDGYEFVQWNDGNTNSIRKITVDSSNTFTAEFDKIEDVYILDSINLYSSAISNEVACVLLKKLTIKRANNNVLSCIDLTGGSPNYYYNGEDGLMLYNEYNGYSKKYTSLAPLTLYLPKNEINRFTTTEWCYLNANVFHINKDTNSNYGTGASLSEYVEINPQSSTATFSIELNKSILYLTLKFVKV